jgi:hypothetical protein
MNLDQKLLVCEAMLARLDAACASAEAEVKHAGALEQHFGRLLAHLDAEQSRLDEKIREVAAGQEGFDLSPQKEPPLADMEQLMSRLRGVQARLARLVPRQAKLCVMPDQEPWGAEDVSPRRGMLELFP